MGFRQLIFTSKNIAEGKLAGIAKSGEVSLFLLIKPPKD